MRIMFFEIGMEPCFFRGLGPENSMTSQGGLLFISEYQIQHYFFPSTGAQTKRAISLSLCLMLM